MKSKGSKENKQNYLEGNTPTYYKGKYKGIEAIDIIFDFELDHCRASALEYILRSGHKDDEVQDLSKAVNMLNKLINHLKQLNK